LPHDNFSEERLTKVALAENDKLLMLHLDETTEEPVL
jgi:hypothetical protein